MKHRVKKLKGRKHICELVNSVIELLFLQWIQSIDWNHHIMKDLQQQPPRLFVSDSTEKREKTS